MEELPPEKEHLVQIMHTVYKFLTQRSLCDLTVYVENACFHLHRCIFAAACPLLHYLILQALENTPGSKDLRLVLHGITALGFKAVLGYIYTGRAPKDEGSHNWIDFVDACQYLSLAYPVLKEGKFSLCQPRNEIQVTLMPRSSDGAIEVIPLKGKEVTDFVNEIEIPMDVTDSSQYSNDISSDIDTSTHEVNSNSDAKESNEDFDAELDTATQVTVLIEKSERVSTPVNFLSNCCPTNTPRKTLTAQKSPESETHHAGTYRTHLGQDCTLRQKPDFSSASASGNTNARDQNEASFTSTIEVYSPHQLDKKRIRKLPARLADNNFQSVNIPDSNFQSVNLPDSKKSISEKKRKSYCKEPGRRCWGCDICGSRFTRRYNLAMHKRSFCGNTSNHFRCLICSREFSSEMGVRGHARRKHPGEKVEVVQEPWKTEKKSYKRKPKDAKNRRFQCEICEGWYEVEFRFQIHKEKCADRQKFRCSQCPRGFTSVIELEKHLWQLHNIA